MSKEQLNSWNYIQALLGVYTFTACNYTPAFFRKGKKCLIEIMLKSDLFINMFNNMGEEDLFDEDIDIRILYMLYVGYSKLTWYTAKLYKNVAVADPLANYTLLDRGFELIDGYVPVKWFDSEQAPEGSEDDDDRAMEHSDSEYVEEVDEVIDDKGSEDGE